MDPEHTFCDMQRVLTKEGKTIWTLAENVKKIELEAEDEEEEEQSFAFYETQDVAKRHGNIMHAAGGRGPGEKKSATAHLQARGGGDAFMVENQELKQQLEEQTKRNEELSKRLAQIEATAREEVSAPDDNDNRAPVRSTVATGAAATATTQQQHAASPITSSSSSSSSSSNGGGGSSSRNAEEKENKANSRPGECCTTM